MNQGACFVKDSRTANDPAFVCRIPVGVHDRTLVGKPLRQVAGLFRTQDANLGSLDPIFHARNLKRFWSGPEERHRDCPWSHFQEIKLSNPLDPRRDMESIQHLSQAVQERR